MHHYVVTTDLWAQVVIRLVRSWEGEDHSDVNMLITVTVECVDNHPKLPLLVVGIFCCPVSRTGGRK